MRSDVKYFLPVPPLVLGASIKILSYNEMGYPLRHRSLNWEVLYSSPRRPQFFQEGYLNTSTPGPQKLIDSVDLEQKNKQHQVFLQGIEIINK